jgi:hypothetical protein
VLKKELLMMEQKKEILSWELRKHMLMHNNKSDYLEVNYFEDD